jgi:hypothetical protein
VVFFAPLGVGAGQSLPALRQKDFKKSVLFNLTATFTKKI